MNCPRDGAPLEPREKAGCAFYFCRHCSGLLIDRHERRKAGLRGLAVEGGASAPRPAPLGKGRMVSPVSGSLMDAIVFQGVTIDLCRRSGHVWLDCGELETIRKQLIAKTRPSEKTKGGADPVELAEIAVEAADSFFSIDEGIEIMFEWILGALDGF
ncbi:MAG: zf-TFIIB domain-containing protein [Desulfobacterales bacterium]|nr:zf-TFIIB domain-containing protein [Desulfobacterales bacterium]